MLTFAEGTENTIMLMLLFHIDMSQVVKVLPQLRQELAYIFYIVNIIDVDVLVMQGARASETMIFTLLNGINSVLARKGLTVD